MNYRGGLVARISNHEARSYILNEFPKSSGAVHQWVTPVLNKIGGLIFDPDIRLMLAGESGIDFRLLLQYSLSQLKNMGLERWLPESEFRIDMDIVDFNVKQKEGKIIRMKRGVCPGAYFEIIDHDRLRENQPAKARFLLEIDMGTHDNPSFGKYKAIPGAAYIKSNSYRDRFGSNHGIWLVVTGGGEKRMMNLLNQTKEKTGKVAGLFYFTTFNLLYSGNLLTNPIWWRADQSSPVSIIGN